MRSTEEVRAVVFRGLIKPGEQNTLVVQPQFYFHPERLVYKGPAKTYRLCSFHVGKNSQFFTSPHPVSMDYFAPGPREQAAYEACMERKEIPADLHKVLTNLGTCDVCHTSLMISLCIENVSPRASTDLTGGFLESQGVYYHGRVAQTEFEYPLFECVMYGRARDECIR